MQYFTLHELTSSTTAARLGIKNQPSAEEIVALCDLVDNVLDPARRKYGHPITVSSGYRCKALNDALKKASKTSQHMHGEAADLITGDPRVNARLARIIYDLGVFDQLILEEANADGTMCDWVHVSYSRSGNRKEVRIKVKGEIHSKPYQFK